MTSSVREARVLSQGHLLLQSSDGFHESQRKVYVVLSDATLKCYDEDPTACRDAKLYASYDLRLVKVLDCSESKHPKSFTVEVRSSSKRSQTRLEFTSPTNSVKFQWMKQLIGATSSLHNSIKAGGEAARSYAVNIAHHRSSPEAIDSHSRQIFDNPFNTRSLSQYNTSTLNRSLSSYMPHDAIASERASILGVPKRPHSSSTALIIAPPEGRLRAATHSSAPTSKNRMTGTEWVPGSYGNNRHSSRKLSPGRAPVQSSRASYGDGSPGQKGHSFDTLTGRRGTSSPRSRSGDLISEHSRSRTEQTQNVGLDGDLLLSKPMGSMTLTELKNAFMTMPAAIKDTLMTPSSTLELMTAADDNELCAPDTADRSYNLYNSVQPEDDRNRSSQRDRSSDVVAEQSDSLYDLSIGLGSNRLRKRPVDMSTPALTKGVFYTQDYPERRPENAPAARSRSPSRISVTPAAAQGRSHSSSKAILSAVDDRGNFTSQLYGRSSAQNTTVPVNQSSRSTQFIDKKQSLERSQKQAWERGVRHELTPTHVRTGTNIDHGSIDEGEPDVGVEVARSSATTVTDQAEWRRMTEWLTRIGLSGYIDNMQSHGVTKLSMIELFSEQDMRLIGISQQDIPIMMRNIREFSKRTRSLSEQALLRDGSSSVSHRVLPHHHAPPPSGTDAIFSSSKLVQGSRDSLTGTSNHTAHVESNISLVCQPPLYYANSDDVANELLRCFDRGEAEQFFLVWKHALLYMPADLTSTVSALVKARQVIEFHLHVHFAVYPMTHNLGKTAEKKATRLLKLYLEEALLYSELSSNDNGAVNEALSPFKCGEHADNESSFFSYSPSASSTKHGLLFAQSREYALCAAIALVPDPKQNVAFQQLLRPDWMQALRRRLADFLTNTILLSVKRTGDELQLGLGDVPHSYDDSGNTDLLISSGGDAADKIPSKRDAADKIPPRGDAADKIPSKRDAADKIPPRGDAADKIPPRGDAVDKIPSRGDAVDKIPPRGDAADKIPPRGDAADKIPSRGDAAADKIPSRGDAAADKIPPRGDAVVKIPSRGDAADKIPSRGDAADKIPPRGDAADKISPRGDAVDKIPSRGDAVDKIPPRGDAVDKIPPRGDAADKIPSRGDATDKIPSRGDAVVKIPPRGDVSDKIPPRGDASIDGVSVVGVGQPRNREKVQRFIKHQTIQDTSYAAVRGRGSGLDDYELSPMHCLSDTNEPLATDFVLEVQIATSPTASEISQLTADSTRHHEAGKLHDAGSSRAHKSPLSIGEAGNPTESAITRKHSPSTSVFTRKIINSTHQLDKADKNSPSIVRSTRPQTGNLAVRSATGTVSRVRNPSASRAMQLQVTKYNKLLRRRQEHVQSIDTAVRTDHSRTDDRIVGRETVEALEVADRVGEVSAVAVDSCGADELADRWIEGTGRADDRMMGESSDDAVEVDDGVDEGIRSAVDRMIRNEVEVGQGELSCR